MRRYVKAVRPEEIFLLRWHPYAWIALAGLLIYFRTLSFGFTNLDDTALITNNYPFLSNASNVLRAFQQKVFAGSILPYYRPLLVVSFIVDAQIGGLSPVMYHAHNVALHIAAACLVFFFLVRIGAGRGGALFCSLIFTVHPALVQAVAWIPGRNDSLAAIFVLAAFACLFDLALTGRGVSVAGHLLFFALALFTKETALALVPLAALYLALIGGGLFAGRGRALLWPGYAVVIAVWAWMRHGATAGSFEMSFYDAAGFLVRYLPAIPQFLGKAVFPVNLSAFPVLDGMTGLYGAAALALGAACLLLSKRRRYPYIVFGILWFVMFLVPSLVRPHAGAVSDVLEHRLYLPIIGLFIVALEIDAVKAMRPRAWAAGSVLLTVFTVLALVHSNDYRDQFSYWENAVRTSPDAAFAHLLLGSAYYDDDRVEEAEVELKKALALDGQLLRGHYFLGLVYMKKLMFRRAADEFRKEIALYPGYDAAYSSLAAAYYKQGLRDGLDRFWRRALDINPDNIEAWRNLAIYCRERGDAAGAMRCVREMEKRGVTPPPEFVRSLGEGRLP